MRAFAGTLVVACGLVTASPAFAQAPGAPAPPAAQGGRPYRGLFGSGGGTDQSLALMLSLVGGFDTSVQTLNSVTVDGSGTPTTRSAVESVRTAFEQANGSLSYSLRRGRASVTASGTASASRYQTLDKLIATYSAGVGAAF